MTLGLTEKFCSVDNKVPCRDSEKVDEKVMSNVHAMNRYHYWINLISGYLKSFLDIEVVTTHNAFKTKLKKPPKLKKRVL